MGLPIDTGVVVQNVGTSYAVYEAVQKNKPLFEGVMTITGQCLGGQHNFLVRTGTTFDRILEHVGGVMWAECRRLRPRSSAEVP